MDMGNAGLLGHFIFNMAEVRMQLLLTSLFTLLLQLFS